MVQEHWISIGETLTSPAARSALCAYAAALASAGEGDDDGHALSPLDELNKSLNQAPATERSAARALALIVRDLIDQGWDVRVRGGLPQVQAPAHHEHRQQARATKDVLRQQLLVSRDKQLDQPAVREFVKRMETRRFHNGEFISVFSLLRDGRELASRLENLQELDSTEERLEALQEITRPYLQFFTGEERCPHTGLLLQDIWRYFRHTWTTPYKSVPGRSMSMLIRDAAAPFHPVIGIATLSSAVVNLKTRDAFIGWAPDDILRQLREAPTDADAAWLLRITDQAIEEIYYADLLEEPSLLTLQEIKRPTPAAIERLIAESERTKALHQAGVVSSEHRRLDDSDDEDAWERKTRLNLFRSKRTRQLATLLRARMLFQERFDDVPDAAGLRRLLSDDLGRRTARSLALKAKADRVGICIADISVCGAVAPYNTLLGGKLVSMMVTSPEVVAAYKERYGGAASVIASSMAGRPIVRPAELVFLSTTSLYNVKAAQYNRLKIPCGEVGGRDGEEIRYHRLESTEGMGTLHFSEETGDALRALLSQSEAGLRVNNLFGEGTNPRMRMLREALTSLGLNSDDLLAHGNPRQVYAIPLVRNLLPFLSGADEHPDYLLPQDEPAARTRQIVRWWARRWMLKRLTRPQTLEATRRHTLIHPITHGARVQLPPEETDQLDLFDDLYG